MVDQPEFRNALQFYVDLVQDAGEKDAAGSSFNECLSQYKDSKVAMWYDATVAAGLLEADDSAVKGKNGYALAPVDKTPASGWLWSWALAPAQAPSEKADLGWKYISFATGPQYLKEAGTKIPGGWAAIPARHPEVDLREIPTTGRPPPRSLQATLDAIVAAPIDNPGTTKRPGLPAGASHVGIPEFQDVGNQCTQQFSRSSQTERIDTTLESCQTSPPQAAADDPDHGSVGGDGARRHQLMTAASTAP